MISLDWLTDELRGVLRWQLAHPGAADHPDAPEVPMAGQRAWGIFLSLNAERAPGFSGPSPLTSAGIEAWSRLHGEPIRPFELAIVRELDDAFMKACRDQQGGGEEAQQEPFSLDRFDAWFGGKKVNVSSRPMSPALFDAVFAGR